MELKDPDFHARLKILIGEEHPYGWAAKVGISKGAFNRIWKEGTVPSPDKLKSIAEFTGVTIDWLLTGEGPMMRGEAVSHQASQPPTWTRTAAWTWMNSTTSP